MLTKVSTLMGKGPLFTFLCLGLFVEANIIYLLLGESLQETRTKRRNNQLNIV